VEPYRHRLDRELWHQRRENDPQSSYMGGEGIALGFSGRALRPSRNRSAPAANGWSATMRELVMFQARWLAGCWRALALWSVGCAAVTPAADSVRSSHLQRAKIFLAAGDFRRAVEAC